MTSSRSPHGGEDHESSLSSGEVELGIPARGELLFLGRMTAAAVASRVDFGFDQIEDMRLALDELCLALLTKAEERDRIQMRIGWKDSSVEVTARLDRGDGRGPAEVSPAQPNELSERILDALVDEHGFGELDGSPNCWMRMRLRDDPA
jgi:hypothetical protein